MTAQKTLLACFAHPDDEAFGTGATLTRYAAEGVNVYLICATRGEVGEISDPALATPETLPQVRENELKCACEKMGINPPLFLDYRDSGMAGTPENDHPNAYTNTPAEDAVPRLVGYIRQLRPDAIITFDPGGGYGHPDHIAIHKHTVAAFHAAADPHQYPEQGEAWQTGRLFYAVIPRSMFKQLRQRMVDLNLDNQPFADIDLDKIGTPDEDITMIMEVGPTVPQKWAALFCHATQFGPQSPFRLLPKDEIEQVMSREYFMLVHPETEASPAHLLAS